MNLRILALTKYEDMGPSSRYRLLQFRSSLLQSGIVLDVEPLFDNTYVSRLYQSEGLDRLAVLRAYGMRLRSVLRRRRYDLAWIEKEALPYLPGALEAALLKVLPGYVVDYDDAVFHIYDQHSSGLVRTMLGSKHDHVMRNAETVIAGNGYLADRARSAGARRVEILPTVVDLERYTPVEEYGESGVRVGWIGSPGTAKFLEPLVPVVEHFARSDGVRFRMIGSGSLTWAEERIEVVPWSEETEVESLRSLSIGIMPLPDNHFERGKCGLKLIQYMAVGLPVIASPVGVNQQIVEPGVNGYLCESPREWIVAIERLTADRNLRRRMGEAGRRKVEQQYSLAVAAPKLAEILLDAVRAQRPAKPLSGQAR